MAGRRTESGTLSGGLPYNRIGEGPPVVALQGLTFENRALSRLEARFMLSPYQPLAEHRSIWVVNRRPGRPVGTTLGEMADDYAEMIRAEFEPPVDVIGISSGGSVAFHLAAEHPDVVRRLVIQDAACRMPEVARGWEREAARLAAAGKWRAVSELMIRTVQPDNVLGHIMARVFSPLMAMGAPRDPTDMIALIEAEDDFDFTARLGEIGAPTLVACGELDPFSGADLARETAAGITNGRSIVYAGRRHGVRGAEFERDLVGYLVGN